MGNTFAEVHDQLEISNDVQVGLAKHFVLGLRAGRFVVDGIPPDMPPGALFRGPSLAVVKMIFGFRLMTARPNFYALHLSQYGGKGLTFMHFAKLFFHAAQFLSQAEDEQVNTGDHVAKAPIEGSLIVFDPDPSDDEVPEELIVLFPPNLTPPVFNACLNEALCQALMSGFDQGTE